MRAVVEDRGVDIELAVAAGEVLAVLGPNGAGKTTALHVIAGLVRPDDGVVRVGRRVLTDTRAGVHVATHDRRIALLLQDPLLFPHLSVLGNVAFAPRSTRPGHWLAEVGAEELSDRRPHRLSGGQAQRVALARALAAEPDVLLLDEPLAGLDVGAAAAVRKVLRRVLARDGRTAVLITHDLLDVVTLADRVAVLENGKVAETGFTATVLATPRSTFAARLAGVNLVRGHATASGALMTPWGTVWSGSPDSDVPAGQPAVALFHPAAVAVYRERPHGSPRNTVEVTVAELDGRGPTVRVRAQDQPDGAPGLAADITADAAVELRLAPGDRVLFAVKAQEVSVCAGP
ncbi:sulfate/molybdate ABC transporter ATP-binding protein [Mycobacterium sp. IDR2000157661]|uniref:sulfate/molybdate ABC transporter ATP-binding protein n=1 Tax=Mycobacterium sp. IDR2000157661 TaxID=2867005 RepID=UPI001EED164D|nr:ATP-binding cassette domain-containing protein [Mycobacterium sp. IDR2000157661]ULE35864.1 ATP-binding cassette domain-containing protein [Mycobacterium sp. IDR2000157661]